MSIDYEFAAVDVDLLVHPKAIAAGVEAMGLWLWGMAWAHKTGADGKLPRHVVLTAWGSSRQVVERLAARLVTSGLWLKTDDGWEIWNYAKKNQSAAEKARRREQGRERMRRLRARARDARDGHGDASRDAHVHDQSDAPAIAPAVTGSDLGSQSTPDADGDTPPGWFVDAAATVSMTIGVEVTDVPARWLEYRGARSRKGWAKGREDAVAWLSTVVRSERRQTAGRVGANGRHHVQSSENRAWDLPPELK